MGCSSLLNLCALLVLVSVPCVLNAMFVDTEWLKNIRTNQRNYGVAVSDVNFDGKPDFIVAGYDGPNFVFVYDSATKTVRNIAEDEPYRALQDRPGMAIGVAVCEIDGDGIEEIYFLNTNQAYAGRATYGDRIIKWRNERYEDLLSDEVNVISSHEHEVLKVSYCVAACDIDGDGKEEIYFLNTNQAYAGRSAYGDKIFKWRNGRYEDLYSDDVNVKLDARQYAGRSVACIDRNGDGQYAFVLATYSGGPTQGKFALIEMDKSISGKVVLRNYGEQAGIAKQTGGRGIVVGPIAGNNGRSDIFFGNEGNSWYANAGANFLFLNKGDGTFVDIAVGAGVADATKTVRGIAMADFNKDGLLDIAYGNWEGPHRLFLQNQRKAGERNITFRDEGYKNQDYQKPTPIRTVIAADFDNDGNLEIFQNNIYHNGDAPNKLFTVKPDNGNVTIETINIGAAVEPQGYGTGAAVTDFDGDGKLELLVSHGEGNKQSLKLFKVSPTKGAGNNWIRIQPKTKQGAPARGAAVKVLTNQGVSHLHVIDGGSGYLCEMEPYAHIGLGGDIPNTLIVQWSDGKTIRLPLTSADLNKEHIIQHPDHPSSPDQADTPTKDCPIGTCDPTVVAGIIKYAEDNDTSAGSTLYRLSWTVLSTLVLVVLFA